MSDTNASGFESVSHEPALDQADAIRYLTSRGIDVEGPLTVRTLSGGVSSTVLAVEGPAGGVIVKRALGRLRVEADWRATRDRSVTEGRAIRVARGLTPDRVPRLIDLDPASKTLVLELAPRSARNWREQLLAESATPSVGRELGQTLAHWHQATWQPWPHAREFVAGGALEELRLRPFHGAVAARYPLLAERVVRYADEVRSARYCLVHGDFSPKNVLVASGFLWIIDFEVAHVGHPAFDVAFLGAHLVLAAIARPAFAGSLRATWLAFAEHYRDRAPQVRSGLALGGHIGCLVLARTDGWSPEPGLTESELASARRLGAALLNSEPVDADAIWNEVARVLA